MIEVSARLRAQQDLLHTMRAPAELSPDGNTSYDRNMPRRVFELRIEQAKVEQLPLILGFIRKLAEYEKLTHEVVADEETLRNSLFGPTPAAEVLLAFRNGSPVGFAVFFTTFSTFAGRPGIYLEDLFVEPEARGLGVGKALLRYLARVAVERGYRGLSWAVLDWNQPSIEFYKRLGAVPLDDWTVYRLSGDALYELAQARTNGI